MLLTIDLGNTCIKLGLFEGNKQLAFNFVPTYQNDYRGQILSFIYKAMVREDQIDDVILSSVVPSVRDKLVKVIYETLNIVPKEINNTKYYGVDLKCDNPKEVGSDLLVMMSFCHHLFKEDLILCSLGTCSVICYINAEGVFRNCIIAPGFKKMREVLTESSAQLPSFEMEKKKSFIATNTIDAMNVGFYNGYIGMVEYLVLSMKKELGVNCRIIACGGGSKDIGPYTRLFNNIEPDLVTKGLNYIYNTYYKNND